MLNRTWAVKLWIIFLLLSCGHLYSQTATYHLHKEASTTSGLFELKTAGPDTASFAVQSIELKNQPAGEYIVKAFDTQAGVPNVSGLIPSGSNVTSIGWPPPGNKSCNHPPS
ncbi:MAG: hypothetical protein L0312_12845, partial [Acidobacteria bacterium]|nr:hypothetical protein [Acidobacteriota bacterium]